MSKELRIVLVGKTGVGKSASGNTILGRVEFEAEITAVSLPPKCEEGRVNINGRNVRVVDTRGLLDTSHSPGEIKHMIEKCMDLSSPGPHVFLIVIQLGRFTQEEQNTVKFMKKIFGEESAKYTMVLFSHRERLREMTIQQVLQQSKELNEFIAQCQGGYHVFNNKEPENRSQVTELLQEIDRMVTRNRGGFYTPQILNKVELEKCMKDSDYEMQRKNRTQEGLFNNKWILCIMVGAMAGSVLGAIRGFSTRGAVGGVIGAIVGAVGGAGLGFILGVVLRLFS